MNKLLIIFLSVALMIQVATGIWTQSVYSKALKISQENLACARLNSNYVFVGNGLCFDTSLLAIKGK